MSEFEVIGEEVQWQGRLLKAGSETYRYPDGSENTIVFSDLKTNTGLGKERFVLDVPKGTQVLDASPPHR